MTALTRRLSQRLVPARLGISPTVESIVRTIVADTVGGEDKIDEQALARTAKAMEGRLQIMPRYLGLPIMGVTMVFDLYGMASSGRPFRRQSLGQRRRQVGQWRRAPISFCGSFLDLYEKMTTVIYFSEICGEEGH